MLCLELQKWLVSFRPFSCKHLPGNVITCGSIALDHAKHQIRVNAVCPAYVDTPMMQRSIKKLPGLDKMIQHISPLGRMAVPEEVANAIVFLCSPSASYISGTGMIIDAVSL